MRLLVSSKPRMLSHARALLLHLGVDAEVLSFDKALQALDTRDYFMIYLSGKEPSTVIQESLKKLSRRKRWQGKLVLFSHHAELEKAAEWGQLVERFLPRRSQICFQFYAVADALSLRPNPRTPVVPSTPSVLPVDIRTLRSDLGRTQAQMAAAIGVNTRTIQNWELVGPSPNAERRLRDLLELHRTLSDYMQTNHIRTWLESPNDAFGGAAPLNLIVEGRTRDVLLEFRRLQTGEPL